MCQQSPPPPKGEVYTAWQYPCAPWRRDLLPATGKAEILVSSRFGVRASYFGVVYEVIPFIKLQKAVNQPAEKKKGKYIPPDSHYYKYGHPLVKKVIFEESDRAILKMFERIFLGKMDDAI
ncbi:MAG TPA: hypothetical protein PKX46_07040 [Clostridia bacterium]|nr:hypothetical protein [Clostridia bacterium]HOR13667.1 hypothetical protein [Clostridia bacterium]